MARLGSKRITGIVGIALSVGVACTQLFGENKPDTLAPIGAPPVSAAPRLRPTVPGAPGAAVVCGAGDERCEGALLQACADDGTSWVTVQRCAAAALCQANPGTCLAATCSTDEMTCAGAVLQKCNAERTGWDLFATCLSPAHCNAGKRQCMPEPCSPGDRRCDRSESDQSPVLEVCRDDRQDWGPLDACVTRELCDQTLISSNPGGLSLGSDGMVQLQAPSLPQTVVQCLLPACAVGEVRCEGARLESCSEGRTGWIVVEECASAALCEASRVSGTSTAQCLPPACGVGQHQCSATGMLQVCDEGRLGFLDQEQCIGPPFCNAVAADQGQAGCRDAPCEAGQMQCNGAQIQVCREDRTALDDSGPPCESAALCNADDPTHAFCEDPVCRRGATSGSEFRCEGAQLQRCSESLTLYDTIQTCVTPALCDASQRQNGCKAPACQPRQHSCSGGFLRTCNADQTGFENTENCGSQAQCDANAGRCADPCEIGSRRCNATSGDLEQCNDLLTGWQPIADCPNVRLCDEPNGRCDICLGNEFSCSDNQLRQCSADGGTFQRQNIGPECAALPNNAGVGVRVCQNNAVVVRPCQFGCTNGICHDCQGNSTQCVNGGQIRRCVNGFYGNPTSCSDGNACNGAESCQNNNCVGGQALSCNDGNQCTNDNCNPGSGCQFPAVPNSQQCVAGGVLQRCSNGQPQLTQCSQQFGCVANQCATCGGGSCNGNQFTPCNGGQLGGTVNCPDDNNNNPCVSPACDPTAGCRLQNVNGTCTVNGAAGTCQGGNCTVTQICTPNQSVRCQNGLPQRCNGNGTGFNNVVNTCDDGNGCTTDGCNAQNATCTHVAITTGVCAPPPPRACNPNTDLCSGGLPQHCNGDGSAFTPIATCSGTTARRCASGQIITATCGPGTVCSNGTCAPAPVAPPPAGCNPACTGTASICRNNRCVQCVTAADCPALTGGNLAQCFAPSCSAAGACSAVPRADRPVCNDNNSCNGPDQCSAAGFCVPTNTEGFLSQFCPTPPDRTCLASFGCQNATGTPTCSRVPEAAGTACRVNGLNGTCAGGRFGAGSCIQNQIQ